MNRMQASRDLEGNYEIFFLIAVSHSLLSISLIFSVSAIFLVLSKQFILAKLWVGKIPRLSPAAKTQKPLEAHSTQKAHSSKK